MRVCVCLGGNGKVLWHLAQLYKINLNKLDIKMLLIAFSEDINTSAGDNHHVLILSSIAIMTANSGFLKSNKVLPGKRR